MRKYLVGFFERFDFKQEDAAFLLAAYDTIMSDESNADAWKLALSIYENDINCDYKKIADIADEAGRRVRVHEYTSDLLIYICMTKHCEDLYRERGIADVVFRDTMLDLKYQIDQCVAVKGVVGTFVPPGWFSGFFKLTKFAFGRLQFVAAPFEHSYEKNGKLLNEESKVLYVHIPRTGTPLLPEECDKSFLRAAEFYKNEISAPIAFACHSWLLYPENRNILKPESNTCRFMERFDIIEEGVYKNNDPLWRVFDTEEQNLNRLTAKTSMQRAYLAHLKNGGKMGYGLGVFFYSEG